MSAFDNPFSSAAEWLCGSVVSGECLASSCLVPPSVAFLLMTPFVIGPPSNDVEEKGIEAHRIFALFGVRRWPWRLVIGSVAAVCALNVLSLSIASGSDAPTRGEALGLSTGAAACLLNAISLAACYSQWRPLGDFHLAWQMAMALVQMVLAGFVASSRLTGHRNETDSAVGPAASVAAGGVAFLGVFIPSAYVLLCRPCWRRQEAEPATDDVASGSTEAATLREDAILPLLQPVPSVYPPINSESDTLGPEKAPQPAVSGAPVDSAGLLSRMTFSWMGPTMAAGYRTPHEQEGLPPLPMQDCSDAVGAAYDSAKEPGQTLWVTLMRAHGRTFAAAALFKLTFDMLQYTGPMLLNGLITFLDQSQSGCAPGGGGVAGCPPPWLGFTFVGLIMASSLTQTALLHQYFFRVFRFGQHLRASTILAVYRKALSLALHARQAQSVGTITNLMSTDAKRLQDSTTYGMMLISGPFQIALCLTLLWRTVGIATLGGLGTMLVLMPLNGIIARLSKKLQARLMGIKDERVSLTSEALAGIRLIKYSAWEDSFVKRIGAVRDTELVRLRSYMLLQQVSAVLWTALPLLVMLATFTTYTLVNGGPPSAPDTFTALSLFSLLRFPLAMMPSAISNLLEAQVSLRRLEGFLAAEDVERDAVTRLPAPAREQGAPLQSRPPAIVVTGGTFSWEPPEHAEAPAEGDIPADATCVPVVLSPPQATPSLRDVSLTVPNGSLVCIVGSVGSGKSSLLHALCGELHRVSGSVAVAGTVAYASQQPFILNASLRDNVLFGRPLRREWYASVLDACQLRHDISLLPAGEETEIGERGISLSGGQKARVALARAVYADADVILLDDVLSAVDSHVGAAIFDRVLCGLLAHRTRVLVTHGLQYIPTADQIVVMSGGRVAEAGTYAELVSESNGPLLCSLVETYRVEATERVRTAQDEATASAEASEPATPVAHSDAAPGDDVADSGVDGDLEAQAEAETPLITAAHEQSGAAKAGAGGGVFAAIAGLALGRQTTTETRTRGTVRAAVYGAYIRALGGKAVTFSLIFLFAAFTASSLGANAYLSVWDAAVDERTSRDENLRYLGTYAGISVGSLAILVVLRVGVALAGVKASRGLHESLLAGVLHLPVSFFDTAPIGRVLNRFSQDIYTADEQLPSTFSSFLNTGFSVFGTIVLIIAVTPWFALALLPLSLAYLWLQRYYVANARELQRLESISRSPIYAHFSETLNGITTIRAFGVTALFADKNARQLDANVRCYFTGTSANRWLAVRLETLGALVTTASALFAVLARYSPNPAFPALAGLSVSTALGIVQSLNWLIRVSADMETQVVSIERIQEYASLPSEESRKAPLPGVALVEPPADWPQRGEVVVTGLRARYRPTTPWVLHGLDLTIAPGEKLGVCGRTGSGKSSLVACLWRMPDVQEGSIVIDGVDTATIPLRTLRSRLAIVPQTPELFTGPLRRSLDIQGEFTDSELMGALQAVGMRDMVDRLPNGLDEPVTEGGAPFSVGQRQLVTVARALLHKRRLLVMDEASSAVDVESDALLQAAVQRQLGDTTVLTIAHRVHTILGSTRVLVLSDGRVRESAPPSQLLGDPSSAFAALVRENR